MRKSQILFLSFCLCLSAVMPIQEARASWLEFFFPMLKKSGPETTLRAPFADENAVVMELDASGNKENQTPLHLRHRTNEKMTLWVQHQIPAYLNFTERTYQDQYSKNAPDFSETGLQEYNKFLQDTNVLKTLSVGGFDVSGFLTDYPIILNAGTVDNRFKWVYQVNVMMTYIKSGVKNLSSLKANESISREYTVTFQLGRSRDAANEAGVFIETWGFKPKK